MVSIALVALGLTLTITDLELENIAKMEQKPSPKKPLANESLLIFSKKNSVAALSQWSDFQLGKSGRLTHPMVLREGSSHYEEINWEDAFAHIGAALNQLDSPNEAIFYTSGRTSNEAAFLYQIICPRIRNE